MDIDLQPFIMALQDTDPHIRARSAEVLGKIGNVDAVPALVAAMFDDNNRSKFDRGLFFQKNVQDVAVDALLEIGGPRVVAEFEQLLTHDDRSWRTRAVGLLRHLSARERDQRADVIRILQGQLQNPDLDMRTLVMEALRGIIVEDNLRS